MTLEGKMRTEDVARELGWCLEYTYQMIHRKGFPNPSRVMGRVLFLDAADIRKYKQTKRRKRAA